MSNKRCPNMNHGKSNPGVKFCPNCGEKFAAFVGAKVCTVERHRHQLKSGGHYCYDCGKNLRAT